MSQRIEANFAFCESDENKSSLVSLLSQDDDDMEFLISPFKNGNPLDNEFLIIDGEDVEIRSESCRLTEADNTTQRGNNNKKKQSDIAIGDLGQTYSKITDKVFYSIALALHLSIILAASFIPQVDGILIL